jgi:hypothetical protein
LPGSQNVKWPGFANQGVVWRNLLIWQMLDVFQPAIAAEWSFCPRGTRASTVVPRPGSDWMDNSPFTKRSRSRMLIRPSPRRFIASIEPDSCVTHNQTDSFICAVHFHCEVLISAVLYRILQCFLKDAK